MLKIFSIIIVAVTLLFRFEIESKFVYPYTLMVSTKAPGQKNLLLDSNSVLFGMRRLVSDIAWIQLLQYYGTREDEEEDSEQVSSGHVHAGKDGEHCEHCEHESGSALGQGRYYDFIAYSQRIARLDPYFFYPCLYSGASLAWNLDRPEQALILLKEGIDNSILVNQPEYWQLSLYSSAILFKMTSRTGDMVNILEKAVIQPKCPVMVKWVLANIYKKTGKYYKALSLFDVIYRSNDETYREFALKQIQSIRQLLNM